MSSLFRSWCFCSRCCSCTADMQSAVRHTTPAVDHPQKPKMGEGAVGAVGLECALQESKNTAPDDALGGFYTASSICSRWGRPPLPTPGSHWGEPQARPSPTYQRLGLGRTRDAFVPCNETPAAWAGSRVPYASLWCTRPQSRVIESDGTGPHAVCLYVGTRSFGNAPVNVRRLGGF